MPSERSGLSDAGRKKIDAICARYPNRQAACLPALHVAQSEFGHITEEAIDAVAAALGISRAHVFGVATFYTMFHREAVGKNVLMVCTNISCMLRGGYEVLAEIEAQLGVKKGETTPDGQFTVVEEECLAACANAPMMICGQDYFLDLDKDKVAAILADLRKNPRSEHVQ
jgi:NADH-quinone oxidoreductase E subunit